MPYCLRASYCPTLIALMDEDHHGAAGAEGPTIGLLEAAQRIYESALPVSRAGSAPDRLYRIASLLTAFATSVYLVDPDGRPIRALRLSELSGATVGPGGALVYPDGRAPLCGVAVPEASLEELRERFVRLGILGLRPTSSDARPA
jgi:hypothetical protein